MTTYNLALIPGDGIGVDVTEAAMRVMVAAGARFGFDLKSETLPWSCAYYHETGGMMPENGIAYLRGFDAIYLGAVGWPLSVPDAVSLHGLLLPIRKAFNQYANIRPHRLLAGVEGPLRTDGFDILCIRENTEGEYAGAGGRVHHGMQNEVAVETSVFTRAGVERILRFGFEQAKARRKHLTSVTKSNAQKYSMVFWDEVTRELAADYPDVTVSHMHIDAMAAKMVMAPQDLDVVVASNLFGDILTDLGGGHSGRAWLCGLGQYQPGPQRAFDVRAGAWISPGHCGQEHRQSDCRDLVRGDDAGASGRGGGGRGCSDGCRGGHGAGNRHASRQEHDGRDHHSGDGRIGGLRSARP